MVKRLWACYSVADHRVPRPFVADLLLYDRLVIPVPSDDDRDRWEGNDWDPDGLDRLLNILGPYAERVEWSKTLRERWAHLRNDPGALVKDVDQRLGALQATRLVMSEQLQAKATADGDVRGVAVYAKPDRFDVRWRWRLGLPFRRKESVMEPGVLVEAGKPLSLGIEERARVVVTELAVPDDKEHSDEEVLQRTVEFVSRADVAEKRAALHEFIASLGEDISLETTVSEVDDLVTALNEVARIHAHASRARGFVHVAAAMEGVMAIRLPWVAALQEPTVAVGEVFIQQHFDAPEPAGLDGAALLAEAKRALN
jgi:hypothetical protein